ncbi:MAG: lamin tail domain-containing protein [Planctomycetaceae bacterium]
MLARLRRSSVAALVAVVAWSGSVHAAGRIRITEVMSNALTLGSMDWWEITNYGATAVDITGWRMDDNSYSFANSLALSPFASGTEPAWSLVGPGESVVFMETASAATLVPQFQSLWNLGSGTGAVRNPKLGSYTGSGASLSSAGDGVVIYDSFGAEINRVAFGAATTGCSFSWSYDSAGVLGSSPAGTVSAPSIAYAYTVTSTSSQTNTGSPGAAVVMAPVVSLYWTGSGSSLGGSGTWNTSSSRWSPTESPVSGGLWAEGRTAVFGGTAGTVTVASSVSPLALSFTTTGYTLASGSGSIAAGDVSIVAGGAATIATRLTGSNGLTLGAGTLLLAGTANDYTGFTSIVGGTLQLAASNVIPNASRLSVARFMLADFNGFSDTVGGLQGQGAVRISGTTTVNITGTTDARLDGFLSGTGDLVVDSAGTGVQRLNTSNQTLNQDFAVKDYVGKTIVRRGGLGVDRSAVPLNTTEVTVEAGGRLLLSPNAAAPDQVFTFGSNPALPVTLAGGTIGQGPGDDVELANTLAVSGTATVAIANKTTPDPLVPSTQQVTFSGPLTGASSTVLRVLASDTTSGLAQSRAKFTAASGNTFAGTVSPGPYAVARFNGDFTQTSVALAGGRVDGYGAIKLVSGTGIVSPDGTSGPDGIFTVGSLVPAGGMSFNLDLGAANTQPTWSNPTQSVNDVLRLTGTTPFTTPLASDNVVRLFLGTTTLSAGDWFDAGFFTTTNRSSAIGSATYSTYVLGDGLGADIEHSGLHYYTLANWNTKAGTSLGSTVTMVSTTASFDGSTSTPGWIMRTTYAVAPSVITINVASGTQTQAQAGYPTLSGSIPVVKTGGGTLVLDQANTLSGSTTVQGGLLRLTNGTALASSRLVVVAGGTGQVAPVTTTSVASLDLASGNGLLDLTSGAITIAAGMTGPQLVAEILEGRGDGSWSGTSGITSSAAAAEVASSIPRAVGWVDNGDGSLTAAYAAPGDTNIDWSIDILDASNFLALGKFDTGLPATWIEGDFSYDGIVDILDAADFFATGLYDAGNYNTAPGMGGGVAAVPEPAVAVGAVIAAVAAAGARLRRRRG